ncbi:hypothetical protein FHS18_006284 [Paenibacillus phyllosphaerae]|uniref:Uncharacterized protein n=1 Tax=Paenibacillus phyllosphaerae TaxID=274593 RepID=A0A7W5B581_9BACL|nr:hypothetical protein [Paenibacillus phyllosphaerae]MBB3114166.1 hypothetical protein [Paenibacillus phyllosphaerae]
MNWEHERVNRYDRTIPRKIPGHALLYDLTERLLGAAIGRHQARLLIVGAGRESGPIAAEEIEALLADAGFTGISRYYGAFLVQWWMSTKE